MNSINSLVPLRCAQCSFRKFASSTLTKFCSWSWKKDECSVGNTLTQISDVPDPDLIETSVGYGMGHGVLLIQPHVKNPKFRDWNKNSQHLLDEAEALVNIIPHWKVVHKLKISIASDNKMMLGTGQVHTLAEQIALDDRISAVLLNVDKLQIIQHTSLQEAWKVPIFDRYTIILHIFNAYAKTQEARLQLGLAELAYLRDRIQHISDLSIDLPCAKELPKSRTKGQTYTETKLNFIKGKEIVLKKKLSALQSRRKIDNVNKTEKRNVPVVAVVGYTNSGKTSLIKSLTKDSNLEPKDRLFATLDVTFHHARLLSQMDVLLVDTIGFISDMPPELVASFNAILEDIRHADMLIHIRDISHPDTTAQKNIVLRTLQKMPLPTHLRKNMVEVCNKMDCLDDVGLKEAMNDKSNGVLISCSQEVGVQQLALHVSKALIRICKMNMKTFRLPLDKSEELAFLYQEAVVEGIEHIEDENFLKISARMSSSTYEKFVGIFDAKKYEC